MSTISLRPHMREANEEQGLQTSQRDRKSAY